MTRWLAASPLLLVAVLGAGAVVVLERDDPAGLIALELRPVGCR